MTVNDDPQPTEPTQEASQPAEPATEPQGGPEGVRRLTRSSGDRVLGGVAGGLGRYFGVDPIIPRIAFAALVFAGGFGLLAYVAAWLFVPDEETGETAAASSRTATVAGIAALVIAVAIVADGPFWWIGGPGIGFVVLVAIIGYALWQSGARGPRGVASRLALVLLAGVLSLVAVAAVFLAAAFGGGGVVAGVVILCGLLAVAGAASGRASWLLVPAVILALPLGVVAAADIEFEGGVGERQYRPATVADVLDRYELGIGELVVDLRGVDLPAGITPLEVELGAGHLVVLVDQDVCVRPDVLIGAGEARVLGRDLDGLDVQLREDAAVADDDVPVLLLDADLGMGQVEVVSDPDQLDDHEGPPFGRFDDDTRYGEGLNTACAATDA